MDHEADSDSRGPIREHCLRGRHLHVAPQGNIAAKSRSERRGVHSLSEPSRWGEGRGYTLNEWPCHVNGVRARCSIWTRTAAQCGLLTVYSDSWGVKMSLFHIFSDTWNHTSVKRERVHAVTFLRGFYSEIPCQSVLLWSRGGGLWFNFF